MDRWVSERESIEKRWPRELKNLSGMRKYLRSGGAVHYHTGLREEEVANFNLYHSLRLEQQRELIKRFPHLIIPPDPWNKKLINLDTEIEGTEEVVRLIRQTPSNVKRGEKW